MYICTQYLQVVEGVLLFLNLQYEHLSRSALKQLRPSLTVAIDTLTHLSTSDEEAAATSCIFQLRGLKLIHKSVLMCIKFFVLQC